MTGGSQHTERTIPVAVTGGVAVGKSTVLEFFSQLGYRVASADAVARDLLDSPQTCSEIGDSLGLEAGWSRDDLKALVMADPDARQRLNEIMHPLIWDRLESESAQVVEVPLLHEAALGSWFKDVVCVLCPAEIQLERLVARFGDEASVHRVIESQLSLYCKALLSDEIIRTDCSLELVRMDVLTIARRIFGDE